MKYVSEEKIRERICNLKETLAWEEKNLTVAMKRMNKVVDDPDAFSKHAASIVEDVMKKRAVVLSLTESISALEVILEKDAMDAEDVLKEIVSDDNRDANVNPELLEVR